jgi:putative ABC transport system permease protein
MDAKNILRTAFGKSGKGRGYILLNIAGLAAGIACCLLIFEYVAFERSYDHLAQYTFGSKICSIE